MTTPTTELPELPAHLVFIDQSDDSTFGSIADDAWGREESKELRLNAPLFTAGQMRDYATSAIERALVAWVDAVVVRMKGRVPGEVFASTVKRAGFDTPLYTAPIPSPAPVGARLDEDALYEVIRKLGHTTRGQTHEVVDAVMAMAKQGGKA